MRVLVLGVNHQIQPRQIKSASSDGKAQDFERQQKERYAVYLANLIEERRVQFVGEEASHREGMIAKVVCDRIGCKYANIEMPPEERAARKIPGGYKDEGSPFTDEERLRMDNEREDDMAARVLAGANGADSILVVCGRAHVAGLVKRFAAGNDVETADLQDTDWYIDNWAEHMLYNL